MSVNRLPPAPLSSSTVEPVIDQAFRAKLLKNARKVLGNSEDAEDAVQETLCKALRSEKYGSLQYSKKNYYLSMVLTTVCADVRRKRNKVTRQESLPVSYSQIPGGDVPPDGALTLQQECEAYREILRQFLDELPEANRVAFQMRKIEGQGCAAIAERLSMPPKVIIKRLHVDLEELRARLKKAFGGDEFLLFQSFATQNEIFPRVHYPTHIDRKHLHSGADVSAYEDSLRDG